MKYARYILIAVLLYLFIASIYSYVSPDITVTSGLNAPDTAPELDEGMVARYRSLILPWIPLIGLILAGWIFFFKRRFARSAALASILLLAYIVWKDFIVLPGTINQKRIAIEHGLSYPLNWMTVFYLISAVMILFPIMKKAEQVEASDR